MDHQAVGIILPNLVHQSTQFAIQIEWLFGK